MSADRIGDVVQMIRDETEYRRTDIRALHEQKADKTDIRRIEKKIDALASQVAGEPQRRWERWVAGASLLVAAAAVLVPLMNGGPT